MPTTYQFDSPNKLRILPVKEINIIFTNANNIQVRNPRDGATFAIEPITRTSDVGTEFMVAHDFTLSFDIMQNDFSAYTTALQYLTNQAYTISTLTVYLSNDMNLKGTWTGEQEAIKINGYTEGYGLGLNSTVAIQYNEKNAFAHVEIKGQIPINLFSQSGVFTETNWGTYNI